MGLTDAPKSGSEFTERSDCAESDITVKNSSTIAAGIVARMLRMITIRMDTSPIPFSCLY
jgi:hypothetical protein